MTSCLNKDLEMTFIYVYQHLNICLFFSVYLKHFNMIQLTFEYSYAVAWKWEKWEHLMKRAISIYIWKGLGLY